LGKPEVFGVNWIGLVRFLQAEIMGLVGALLLIPVIWLAVRSIVGRGAGVSPARGFVRGPAAAHHCWRWLSSTGCCGTSLRWRPPIVSLGTTSTVRRSTNGWMPSSRNWAGKDDTMGFRFLRRLRLIALGGLALAACDQSYQNISPNYIGMKLTPTGYEDTIYTPGQVDIGTTSQAGQGNQLVLIQRSGVEIKEQFIGKEGNKDGADHRCLTQDQNPMTLDVRLVLALPDDSTPQGKKDLKTLFMLGNPTPMQGNARILVLSAESVYEQQAQLQVRGHIRKICSQYPDFAAAFKAFGNEKDNLT
jgi:hypothetical protein